MANLYRMFRSLTFGKRPAAGSRPYGNPYVNFADRQIGVMDVGGNPQDFIGVPFFSTTANYNVGNPVVYQGQLYLAAVNVTAGQWNPAQWALAASTVSSNSGKLTYVSAGTLKFAPFNGDRIKINGSLYQIPSAGIVGLQSVACTIDGHTGNLAAYQRYFVYCFNNAGVLTAEFSTTGHITSTTTGNIGTEIKSGDDTRTLIGVVAMTGNTTFSDTAQYRYVRTWFNREPIQIGIGELNWGWAGPTGSSYAYTGCGVACLTWANEAVMITTTGTLLNDTGGANVGLGIFIDGNQTYMGTSFSIAVPNSYFNCNCSWSGVLGSEVVHSILIYYNCTQGNSYGYTGMVGIMG